MNQSYKTLPARKCLFVYQEIPSRFLLKKSSAGTGISPVCRAAPISNYFLQF